MIEFRKVTKRFGLRTVLDRIDLSIGKGEIVFIIGKSGVGKSVLLKHIVGLMRPEEGEIWVGEREVTRLGEEDLLEVRVSCGMVFQHPALLDFLTTFENIAFGLRAHRCCSSEEEIMGKVFEKMECVNLKQEVAFRYPTELSYGAQKRVSVARALVLEPSYLLFDEPTTGLDPILTNSIHQLIRSLSKRLCVTSLVVSHDMRGALETADRIVMIDGGKIITEGNRQAMLACQHPLVREFLAG